MPFFQSAQFWHKATQQWLLTQVSQPESSESLNFTKRVDQNLKKVKQDKKSI